jgi:polyferredoxin
MGILLFIILISGRKLCGKFCPYGLLQDLIYKIRFPVKIRNFSGDKYLRYLKCGLVFLPFFNNVYENIKLPLFANIMIFVFVILITIIISRPMCKYLCPFGIILAIGNKIPSKKYEVKHEKCTECGLCVKKCKMDIIPYKQINNIECIYCETCLKICPCKAIYKKPRLPSVANGQKKNDA